ncbi:interferon alpha/beta receptor 1 isoform X2 [Hyla sarda]|nr:interferon alpha/beta receptor 1 isoform X2 [Hyla sarda]
MKVNFTASYKKVGDSELQTCEKTESCSCKIPSNSLDESQNYTLVVTATTPEGETLSDSKDFDPNHKLPPPPDVSVASDNALVIVHISTKGLAYSETYKLILRRMNDSTEEEPKELHRRTYVFPPHELVPEQTYCMKVNVYNKLTMESSLFSEEECFTAPAKGQPNNLTMEALDTRNLLKWDWDYDQSPNATFSVEECNYYDGKCTTIQGCENITTTKCNCSGLKFKRTYILRASVYDSQKEEKSSRVILFTPDKDTIIGPPKNVKMQIVDHELYINVSAPEGFRNTEINFLCKWRTHLEYWTNSTRGSEDKEEPFFKIKSLEPSTTYCAKAKMQCADSNRSSQYSEVDCITTDPKSYLVAWITVFSFFGVVVIPVVLYFCFCPMKRYIKHTFFPSRRLPSSIEKGFGESPLNCMKYSFLLHEEETMDRCYIVQDSHNVQQNINANSSNATSQDSGNYSNEGQTTSSH